MHTFPEIDRFKAMMDQHHPLDPAIVRNLREDLIVRWTYHSNAIEGNTLTLQEHSGAGFSHDACVSHDVGEFFHKETCHLRRICEAPVNTPAKPLNDAQLGGYFFSTRPATLPDSSACAPRRVTYSIPGHTETTSEDKARHSPEQPKLRRPGDDFQWWQAHLSLLEEPKCASLWWSLGRENPDSVF